MGSKASKEAPAGTSSERGLMTSNPKDPDFKGEPLDDRLANGPLENRRCTDCLCCLIFVAFVICWIGAGLYGYSRGDPKLLTYPFDSDGNQCGRPSSNTENYQYVYWPFPIPGSFDVMVCLKACPTSYSDQPDCYPNSRVPNCEMRYEDIYKSPNLLYGYLQGIYPCDGLVKRICMPQQLTGWAHSAYSDASKQADLQAVVKWMGDVYTVWPTILIVAGFALGIAILYFIFLRYCVGIVVWFSILFILCLVLAVASLLLWTAHNMYTDNTQADTRKTLEIVSYVTYAVAGVFFLYILFMCKRIRLAIAILKSGTLYMRDVWSALLLPPLFFVCTLGLYIYWTLATLYLYTSGDVQKGSTAFPQSNMTYKERNIYYFHFFGVLWTNAFVIALEQFVLGSSVCIWYFAQNSDSGVHRPVSRSFWRAFRYHLGSLAFGSFILAVIQFIKWVLRYINAKLKATKASNRLIEWVMGILMCYVNCFERFIKFINRNAYIQIALTSKSFCMACKDVFFLILRQAGSFLTLGSIGNVFMFLGKWVICLLSSYLGYILLTRASRWKDDINSPVFPVIVTSTQVYLLLTYALASLFMTVYSMAVDAILLCYFADCELMEKAGKAFPAHAPGPILDFMGREKEKTVVTSSVPKKKGCCGCCGCC